MTLSIGTLVGYLELDDTKFERKAEQAKRQMDALKLQLDAVAKANPKLDMDVRVKKDQLDALQIKLDELRAKGKEGVDVRVDAVRAMSDLAALRAEIMKMNATTISPKVDPAAAKNVEKTTSAMKVLITTAVMVGPALIPLGAGLAGLGAGGLVAALGIKRAAQSNEAFRAELGQTKTALNKLEDASANAIAPGLTSALHTMLTTVPELRPFLADMASELGHLAEQGAQGLANDLPSILAYLRQEGPVAVTTVKDLGGALVGIAKAAAPLGQEVLPVLDGVLKVIAAIGNSPLGPAIYDGVAALMLYKNVLAPMEGVIARYMGIKAAATEAAAAEAAASEAGAAGGGAAVGLTAAARSAALPVVVATALGIGAGAAADRSLSTKRAAADDSLQKLVASQAPTHSADQYLSYSDLINGAKTTPTTSHLGGLATSGRTGEQNAELGSADQTLAAAVAGGGQGATQASQFMAKLTKDTVAAGGSIAQVTAAFPKYTAAAKAAASGTSALGASSKKAATDTAALAAKMQAQRQAARTTAQSFVGLGSSLDNSKVSLSDWIKSMAGQAAALRDFRTNAQEAAKKGLDQGLIASLEKAGSAGALRMQQLAGATKSQLGAANKAWQAQIHQMQAWVNFKVPPKKLSVDAAGALSTINALQAAINAVHGKTVVETTVIQSKLAKDKTLATAKADGGTVQKTGMPYADRHLHLLADGEEVISNRYGQADRHRGLLKAINAGRLADGGTVDVKHLAGGGTVGGTAPVVGHGNAALVAELRALRAELRTRPTQPTPVRVVNHREVAGAVQGAAHHAMLTELDYRGL